MNVVAVILIAANLALTVGLLWWLGTVSREQAAEARRLAAEWKALELARVGNCRSLGECTGKTKALTHLRTENSFLLDRARSTGQPPRPIP